MKEDIEAQYNIVCELTDEDSFIQGNVQEFARDVVKKSFHLFNCSRMSFWIFNESRNTLNCQFFYEGQGFDKGPSLRMEETPVYFERLKEGRTVNAPKAQTNPISRELNEIYLVPENVVSLLDSAIYDGEKIIGVVSLEGRGRIKRWSEHEVKFAAVLGNLISNCFVINRRIEAEKSLLEHRKELEEMNLTLKNVLSQIEEEKKSQIENVATNIEQNISPLLEEIKDKVGEDFYRQLEGNLSSLTSNFYRRLARFNYNLTPTEIKVCQLIKIGFRGKEIANSLNLSFHTVEAHKKNIRKKLGLTGRPINLKVALEEIDHANPND